MFDLISPVAKTGTGQTAANSAMPSVMDDMYVVDWRERSVIDLFENDTGSMEIATINGEDVGNKTFFRIYDGADLAGFLRLLDGGEMDVRPLRGTEAFSFTYTAADGDDESAGATVTVWNADEYVDPANAAPVASDDYFGLDWRGRTTIDLLGNDTDAEGDMLSIATIDGEAVGNRSFFRFFNEDGDLQGFIKIMPDGSIEARTLRGVEAISFTYAVTDGNTVSEEATATITNTAETYTLNLLHFADQEAAARAVEDAPRFSGVLNALRDEDVGADGVLTLSSGDAFIPGLFYDASEAVYGDGGIADIMIQNELGVQAIAFGNHEFDYNTEQLGQLIRGDATTLDGVTFTGTDMPYLSANLDVSTDANLADLEVAGGGAPLANTISSSVVIEEGGETIGVVGATTPRLGVISSPGDVTVTPDWQNNAPTEAELAALAAEIQAEVDALLDANPEMNKVVLLAHMQQIGIEFGLAELLENVDVIVAGGSNTRLLDEDDRLRDGDSVQGVYPTFIDNAGGTTTAVVNTDGSYQYVGRLVIDFDSGGNIIAESYDAAESGAFAADDQGVADLGAEGLIDPEIQDIADAILDQIVATESNVFGISEVFLNGNRSGTFEAGDTDGVRTQETNLGNLSADANLEYANDMWGDGDDVWLSIKNGGGIRASIGETVVPPGGGDYVRTVNSEVIDADGNVIKPVGGISQNDVQSTLAFNNDLVAGNLTATEIVELLEHGIGAYPTVDGRFVQVAGVQFSFDPDAAEGARIEDAAFIDGDGNIRAVLVDDGVIVDPDAEYGVVTLGYLAGGGDGYPFPVADEGEDPWYDTLLMEGTTTGGATFADDGSEQDALAEYLLANHATTETAYAEADTGPEDDLRIQNLDFQDGLALDAAIDAFILA